MPKKVFFNEKNQKFDIEEQKTNINILNKL